MLTLAALAWCQPENGRVDRVGDTGFLQLEADSFQELDAARTGRRLIGFLRLPSRSIPIIYDQLSRFGLREKRVLELVAAHPQGVNPAAYEKILAFTKLFWANRGNHNETTAQKFLPEFTFEELRDAGLAAIKHGAGRFHRQPRFSKEIEELRPSLFDPNFEPMITAKSPRGGQDILQASSNNFYFGVTLADRQEFH